MPGVSNFICNSGVLANVDGHSELPAEYPYSRLLQLLDTIITWERRPTNISAPTPNSRSRCASLFGGLNIVLSICYRNALTEVFG